jgi:flagellar biosynthesis protein FlhB
VAESEQDASDRTEDPTQRRLDQALERGDVVKSQEVNAWFVIAAATLALLAFSNSMGSGLTSTFRGLIANSYAIPVDGGGALRLFKQLGVEIMAAVAIPFLLLMLAAIGGNMIQHRLVWSTEALKPKLSKVSLASGFKRLFSKQAVANFVKGLLKLALLGAIMVALLWPQRYRLESLIGMDPLAVAMLSKTLSLELMGAVVAVLALVAAADYLFQYRQWYEKQKMSLKEIKDEFKETDGDPKIKAKIRQLRQSRVRKRMMAAVPTATVVITNPTHFAVALKYDRGMTAPVCVAKGQDMIALKIREVAKQNNVPVVENPPLARALHATVEVDQEINPEHYKAVAEVIGHIMRLNRSMAH